MYYLDTCAILGPLSSDEEERENAEKLLNMLKENEFCTSTYTLLEMHTTVARKKKKFEIPFTRKAVTPKAKIKAVIKYCLDQLGVSILSDDPELEKIQPRDAEIQIWSNYFRGVKLAPSLQMASGDIQHVSHAISISRGRELQGIASIDGDFEDFRQEITEYAGLEVITPFED